MNKESDSPKIPDDFNDAFPEIGKEVVELAVLKAMQSKEFQPGTYTWVDIKFGILIKGDCEPTNGETESAYSPGNCQLVCGCIPGLGCWCV